jgi:hypothetical protein
VYSTTLVQYLHISCYLSDNKPVLSYLLSRLLPQDCFFKTYFLIRTINQKDTSDLVPCKMALVSLYLFIKLSITRFNSLFEMQGSFTKLVVIMPLEEKSLSGRFWRSRR